MIKKLPIATLLNLIFFLSSISQTIYRHCEDGYIYFKLKDNYPVLESANDRQINPVQTDFLQALNENYQIHDLRTPFKDCHSTRLKRTYRLGFADFEKVDEIVAFLNNQEMVEYAEKAPFFELDYTPDDPYYTVTDMWHLFKINAGQAWEVSKGDPKIVVAVTDIAIATTHPDLAANMVGGVDVADNDFDPNPPQYTNSWVHGTHVAGIVAASTDNGAGIASIGFNVSIMPVKCAPNSNPGDISMVLMGVAWAAENGADVINMSWGTYTFAQVIVDVMNYAEGLGCVLVSSAGNESTSTPKYPGSLSNVMATANTNSSDVLHTGSGGSNYGSWVNISAPGTNILSTIFTSNPPYAGITGTSMAAPLVAGLCGLVLSKYPDATSSQVWNFIQSNATNINALNPSYNGLMGAGRINASATMNAVDSYIQNNVAPNTSFTTDYISVIEGGSVQFIDQTLYNPTSWSWNFGDGSPVSSLQNPAHVYQTPGAYTATLTASNANGSTIYSLTSMINVAPKQSCDTIANIGPNDPTILVTNQPNTWGYPSGHNGFGQIAVAEYFGDFHPYSYITGAYINFAVGATNNPNATVNAKLYSNNNGIPGGVLASKTMLLQDIEQDVQNNQVTRLTFLNPVQVTGPFFLGIEFLYATGDTVALYIQDFSTSYGNTAWMQDGPLGGLGWYNFSQVYGVNTSYDIRPVMSEVSGQASFSQSVSQICELEQVIFDAGNSTDISAYMWTFNGGNPSNSSQMNETVSYDIPGTFNVILATTGGCTVDTSLSQVIVDICADVNDLTLNKAQLYFDSYLNLLSINSGDANAINKEMTITNVMGQLVYLGGINQDEPLDVSDYAIGLYIAYIKDNETVSAHKFVKK